MCLWRQHLHHPANLELASGFPRSPATTFSGNVINNVGDHLCCVFGFVDLFTTTYTCVKIEVVYFVEAILLGQTKLLRGVCHQGKGTSMLKSEDCTTTVLNTSRQRCMWPGIQASSAPRIRTTCVQLLLSTEQPTVVVATSLNLIKLLATSGRGR